MVPPASFPVRLVLPALLLIPLLECAADPGAETQLWSDVKITARLSEGLDVIAMPGSRFDQVGDALNRASFQVGLNVHATSWLTLTPTYQYVINAPSVNHPTREDHVRLVAAARVPLGRAEMTVSTGVDYRSRENAGDGWRVRPRLKLAHALGPEKWRCSGYVADELFYDVGAKEWTRNRFFAGFEKKFGADWSVDLYYCRQSESGMVRPDLNIVGLQIGWRFDPHGGGPTLIHPPEAAVR